MRTFLEIKLVLEISTKMNMVTFLTDIRTQKTKDIQTFDITYATSMMILILCSYIQYLFYNVLRFCLANVKDVTFISKERH